MKNIFLLKFLLILLLCMYFVEGNAQEKAAGDTLNQASQDINVAIKKKLRKNSIMINISNPSLISSQFRMIGYERVLPHNQSFTVNFGEFSIPRFRSGHLADSLGLNTESKDRGFHFSTDYRFYLIKENRYAAPRGVYLAPYYTYNHLNRRNSWIIEGYVDEVFTNLKLNIHTLGAELGYQFIFWDRVALDLILLGPGIGFYSVKTEIGTTLDPVKESELFKKINEILADRIPGYDKVIEAGEFSKRGTYDVKNVGFRYAIRVGFRF